MMPHARSGACFFGIPDAVVAHGQQEGARLSSEANLYTLRLRVSGGIVGRFLSDPVELGRYRALYRR